MRKIKRRCCHHWIIDVATGPSSRGVCKVCGEEMLFRNQLQWAEIAPLKDLKSRRRGKDITTPDDSEVPVFVLAGSRYGSPSSLQSAGRGY
jgi:hypothetical protein